MEPFDEAYARILDFLQLTQADIGEELEDYIHQRIEASRGADQSRTTIDSLRNDALFPFLHKLAAAASVRFDEVSHKQLPMFALMKGLYLIDYLELLGKKDVVDKYGNPTGFTFEQYFSRKVTNDTDSFWDEYFEMEVAYYLHDTGFEGRVVNESAAEGVAPDVLTEFGERDWWIECKNKRGKMPIEWDMERFAREIVDNAWANEALGDILGEDSVAVRISSESDPTSTFHEDPELRTNAVGGVSRAIVDLLREGEQFVNLMFDGIDINVEVVDHYEGRSRVELTEQELAAAKQMGNPARMIDPTAHLDIDQDFLRTHGQFSAKSEFDDGSIEVFSAVHFEFDVDWDVSYEKWILSTVQGAKKQLKKHDDLIVFVKVPKGIVRAMMIEETIDHNGEKVTKWERLKQRIGGMFNAGSGRVKAVVLSSDIMSVGPDRCSFHHTLEVIENRDVSDDLPGEFYEMISHKVSLEEAFQLEGNVTVSDQSF